MAGEIRVVSTSVVQARNNKKQRIELSPCDVLCLTIGPIQRGLLFLKPNPSETDELLFGGRSFVEHLRNSLSATLDYFFPLAGRLAKVEHDGGETLSFFIDCNNEGARFVHAVADHVRVADILEPIYVPRFVHSFFTLNWSLGHEGVSKPLLGVQVTELVDGIFIGCTMNHSVADGSSFWNFLNSWSEISRGSTQIPNPPIFDRSPSLFGSTDDIAFRIPNSLIKLVEEFVRPPPLQLQERFFHFSNPKIAELKAKANADQAGGSENISSLQSLLAHIWRSAIRNREVNPDGGPISLFYPVGFRARIDPHLPPQYFGNAFVVGETSLKDQDLIEHGIGYAAVQIYKNVRLFTGEKIKSWLQDFVQNPKLSNLRSIAKTILRVGSSPRYNVYGNDFGWGKPIAVRSGSGNKVCWNLTLFQGVEEGSIDVQVCTSPQVLDAMGNDLEFMDAVLSY